MDATKDYYKVLGVPETAEKSEIKAAFRKLAKKYHPDRNPGNAKAAARFRYINEAYSVLEDEKERTRYDRLRRLGVGLDLAVGPGYDLNDLKDIVSERMSGVADLFQGFMGSKKSSSDKDGSEKLGPKGRDLTYKVSISIEKSIKGGKATFSIPSNRDGGSSRKVKIDLAPGVAHGEKVCLEGQGRPGKRGGPQGDLYLKIAIVDSDTFRMDGERIVHPLRLNLKQALLGTTVEVPTPTGKKGTLKVPSGTQPGTKFRLKGMAGRDKDLFVEVELELPGKLNPEAEAKFLEFCESAQLSS